MAELTDSLRIKQLFWERKKKIPGTPWEICGYSRSAYRTGFYIAALDMMLDAGPQNFNKPEHILITHTHIDHLACLPLTMIGESETIPTIYAVSAAQQHIHNYIAAMFSANAMETVDPTPFYKFVGLDHGNTFEIAANKTKLTVEVFNCDHAIPTISYGFSETRKKMKPEYLKLPGAEIKKLRMEGVDITADVVFKQFAYVCDTSIEVFQLNPTLLDYPTIFIECTFLLADELENAIKTSHIHWEQLKPVVENNPKTTFVLFHFSQRYRDSEIAAFFDKEKVPNVIWW